MAFGFEGELQFVLAQPATGGSPHAWTITVTDSKAHARAREATDPRVTLRAGVADFVRIATGEANPGALLLEGKLEVEGDLSLAPRLSEMFGGPSPY
jgi:putative sterol carrier protein